MGSLLGGGRKHFGKTKGSWEGARLFSSGEWEEAAEGKEQAVLRQCLEIDQYTWHKPNEGPYDMGFKAPSQITFFPVLVWLDQEIIHVSLR